MAFAAVVEARFVLVAAKGGRGAPYWGGAAMGRRVLVVGGGGAIVACRGGWAMSVESG